MLLRVLLIVLVLVLPVPVLAIDMNVTGSGTVAIAQGLALTPAPSLCGAGIAARGIDATGNATGCFTPGDAFTNTATSVDNELVLFSGTAGKTLKRATATGLLKATGGVLGAAVAGTDYQAALGFAPVPPTRTVCGDALSADVTCTASDVGLGNVTNAAQLLRTQNDFSSFPVKSIPVAGDILLIEDSAGAPVGTKKFVTLGSLPISDAQVPDLNTLTTGLAISRCVQTNGTDGKLTVAAGPCGVTGGAVGIFGSPIAGQVAVWHDGTSIEGASALTISYAAAPVASSGTASTGIEYVDTSSAPVTRTLPAAASGTNSRRFTFVKQDSSANAMTVAPAGTNAINGISGLPGAVSTATQWAGFILQESSATGWVATPFAPTLSGSSAPGGTAGQVQWNNGGSVLVGSSGLTLGSTHIFGINQRTTPLGSAGGAATTTLTTAHGPIIPCTGGTGDKTMTLPAVGSTPQSTWLMVKVDAGTGACEFAPFGGERINGVVNARARATTQNSQVRVDIVDNPLGPNWAAVSGATVVDPASGGTGVVSPTGILQANGTNPMTPLTSITVGQTLRVTSANAFAFGPLDLSLGAAVANRLPYANITASTAASQLLGRGSASGAGNWEPLTATLPLAISGTALTVGAASTAAAGIVELADSTETTLGTDTTRAVTPRGLATSGWGRRYIQVDVIPETTDVTTGTGKYFWPVHLDFDGWIILDIEAHLGAAVSSSGLVTMSLDRCPAVATGAHCSSGTIVSVLSTNLTIDANEESSRNAVNFPVINTANDNLSAGQSLRFNVTTQGTGAKGLSATLTLALP